MTAEEPSDLDGEIRQAQDRIGEIKRIMTNVIAYISKRAELTFSQLRMNKVEISLYDVVKSTGEVKDTFKFTYGGAGMTGSPFPRRFGRAWRCRS